MEIVIDLPPPPSVNKTRKVDWANVKHHKRWLKNADALFLAAKVRSVNPLRGQHIAGRYEATITLSDKLNRLDADNAIKAVLDYGVRVALVSDDSPKYMRRLVVEFGAAIEGCRLTLREWKQ